MQLRNKKSMNKHPMIKPVTDDDWQEELVQYCSKSAILKRLQDKDCAFNKIKNESEYSRSDFENVELSTKGRQNSENENRNLSEYEPVINTISHKIILKEMLTNSNKTIMDVKVEEFVAEVMSTISQMSNQSRSNSVKKLRGIIKKNFGYGENIGRIRKTEKPRVHFSDEIITFEIPRHQLSYQEVVKEMFCYYCCFGFLFPNI